jgi:hypothetical protein
VTAVVQALVTEVRKEVKRLQEELEAAKVRPCPHTAPPLLFPLNSHLQSRIGEAESALIVAREKNERELKEVKRELVERLDRIQSSVRVESSARREEVERIQKQYAREIHDIQELEAAETVSRMDDVSLVRGRLEVLEHQEVKAAERAQLLIFEQLRQLRRMIQVETEERLVEEEKVAGSLEEYASVIKKGLKIVNKNDHK